MIHIYKLMYVNLYLEYWLEKYTPKMLTIVLSEWDGEQVTVTLFFFCRLMLSITEHVLL